MAARPYKSRSLPPHVKDHRRQLRLAEQASLKSRRDEISAAIRSLACSFAPSQQEACSLIDLSGRGHNWEMDICFGRGKDFDDIGRWYCKVTRSTLKKLTKYLIDDCPYRQCNAEAHFGLTCRKLKFVTGRLTDAQRWDLKKLWALHDSLKNRTGKAKKYRYGRHSSPPIELLRLASEVEASTISSNTPDQTCRSENRIYPRNYGSSMEASVSCPPRHHSRLEISHSSGSAIQPAVRNTSARQSSCQKPIIHVSDDDEVPPLNIAFKDLIACTSRLRKPAASGTTSCEVIELFSDSEEEVVVKAPVSVISEGRGNDFFRPVSNVAYQTLIDVIDISSD
ncbi:hypothetical protein CVT26_005505 [Gymnopilus dilepis]|uniref:Uncharacterized protein n=1 Tax=Gymnopilus dilepis TaxID=231916 RepID=A0A409WJK4_9AGAR|nr:hypothetical protein CVT26_005505 [Gymnopilus dilepis]